MVNKILYNQSSINFKTLLLLALLFSLTEPINANERVLVWADEFDGPAIDEKYWSYEIGPTNDNIHYYTTRTQNAEIVNGVLQIRALEETYEGYDYTAALISTKNSLAWRYGRFEARIKLPGTKGFVPAFWMLPINNSYGWWPHSGEIDIMEYPSNEAVNIYGTVHTEAYNLFSGSDLPQGDQIAVGDADDAFHVYAVEWTPEKIDFFMDDQLYYTFTNDNGDTDTWPFNQPFYLILNLAVGGGWVGNPDATTVFPAVLEVDYVRVYQYPEDMALNGVDFATPNTKSQWYFAPELPAANYSWSVPNRAQIVSGQASSELEVDWDIFGGFVELESTNGIMTYPVEISNNLFKNGSFEKGVKYWNRAVQNLLDADITLSDNEQADAEHSIYVYVNTPGSNPWDVQLSQENISLKSGSSYTLSFQAKALSGNGGVAISLIHPTNFSVYAQNNFTLSNTWEAYTYSFNSSVTEDALFTLDMGDHTGVYYFDDFKLLPTNINMVNQVVNASFNEDSSNWGITTNSSADAGIRIVDGEAHILIIQEGSDPWDIHFGQTGFALEQGKTYEISFDARATSERDISVIAGLNAEPWTVYSGENIFSLNSRRTSYSFNFTMTDATDNNARLGFDLGGTMGDVIIDNVFLSTADQPTGITNFPGLESESILSVHPNPVSSGMYISYRIEKAMHMKLDLYTSDGRLVETIFEGSRSAGAYRMVWNRNTLPGGIYYLVLTSEGIQGSQKLILK